MADNHTSSDSQPQDDTDTHSSCNDPVINNENKIRTDVIRTSRASYDNISSSALICLNLGEGSNITQQDVDNIQRMNSIIRGEIRKLDRLCSSVHHTYHGKLN